MVLAIAIITVIFSMGLVILYGILNKSPFDKILAVNTFGTNTVIIIALLGELFTRNSYIDIAMIYALINFVTTIAFLKFFKNEDFGEEL